MPEAGLSPHAQRLVALLQDRDGAVSPRSFPVDRAGAMRPGMYSWWADEQARTQLGEALSAELAELIYVGQAGATKWPSGTTSAATLTSRIGRQHISGNARSSTFRLTISALLLDQLGLVPVDGGRLDASSNAVVTPMDRRSPARHNRALRRPRHTLGAVEGEVVAYLDPPLNLGHCLPSHARARLTQLRRRVRNE